LAVIAPYLTETLLFLVKFKLSFSYKTAFIQIHTIYIGPLVL